MKQAIKIIIAIMLFICLAKMPYGYYELVRVAAFIGFAYLAYEANRRNRREAMFVYIGAAILFNPIFKTPLGREIWMIVDGVTGVLLIGYTIYELKKKK